MELNEYQNASRQYASYPALGHNWYYPAFGLAEEAGEVCGKFAKALRDDKWVLTPERSEELHKELGDVLWMLANLAAELGFTLNDIARGNLIKLEDRKKRDVIHGSGDNR